MAAKCDIQATRSTAAAGTDAIIAPPVRLRGIIIASSGGGAGVLRPPPNTPPTHIILLPL